MLYIPLPVLQKHSPREQTGVWAGAHVISLSQSLLREHESQNAAKETLCYLKKIALFA